MSAPAPPTAPAGPLLTGAAVLAVAVLGAPQVWEVLRSGQFGPALLYYPVVAAVLGTLAVRRSR